MFVGVFGFFLCCFFFNDTATTDIYTLSLHDALPICNKAEKKSVERMIEALSHRGPDESGLWEEPTGGAVLGHTRLSIIDLSSAGHQPMTHGNGRYWITFNGEIYNYQELYKELENDGAKFASHSDTEVILAAFAKWGTKCFERLRGMFALGHTNHHQWWKPGDAQ